MKPWWDEPMLVIDVETTGFGKSDRICQLGATHMQNRNLVRKYGQLVNPGRPIENSHIHNITDEMVAGSEYMNEVASRFMKLADKFDVIGGYNLQFDNRMIDAETGGRWSEILSNKIVIDGIKLVRLKMVGRFWKGRGRHKLANAANNLGIEIPDDLIMHQASSDCLVTGWVIHECVSGDAYRDEVREFLGPDGKIAQSRLEMTARDFDNHMKRFKEKTDA
jgi:DNA polymerase III epsilon subunit-like protein